MILQIHKIRRYIIKLIKKSPIAYQIRLLTNKLIKILKKLEIYTPIKRYIFTKLTPVSSDAFIFFSHFITKGDLCFDIGAWEGEVTQIFLKLGANVVAVEPQERCFEKLKIYFDNNKKVKLLKKAVGEKHGFGEIALCDYNTQLSSLSSRFISESRFTINNRWQKKQPIEIITLDSLINKFGIPKFCKIDVEGYENYVLRGLSHPIQYISFEYIKEFFDLAEECCTILSKLGDVRFKIFPHFNDKLSSKEWLKLKDFIEELKSLTNNISSGDIYANFISD